MDLYVKSLISQLLSVLIEGENRVVIEVERVVIWCYPEVKVYSERTSFHDDVPTLLSYLLLYITVAYVGNICSLSNIVLTFLQIATFRAASHGSLTSTLS